MSKKWPNVHLGEVLSHRKEFIRVDDLNEYKRCRVQLHAQGVVLRDTVMGMELRTKQQQVCKAGEFLVAEIDAKVGGFGIVPQELEGAIVSSHYFLFGVDDARLDKKFLGYFIQTPQFMEQVSAQGSTNYASIRPQHVLEYEIPLPPLDEQRRIVARIEALAARIEEARGLRQGAIEEAEALWYSSLRQLREEMLQNDDAIDRLGNISTITSGGTPSRAVASYWNGDIPWIKTGELRDNDIGEAEEYITNEGLESSSAKLFPPETVLVALYGQGQTRGRTGRLMFEAATNQACCAILPTEKLEPRYLQYWIRSLYSEMREVSHGGAQPNWNSKNIKEISIAVPPRGIQRDIIAHLDDLQAHVDDLKRLQAETAAELDALLPTILDRAFKGEL